MQLQEEFNEVVVPFTGVIILKADHSTQHDLERQAVNLLFDMEVRANKKAIAG